MTKVLKKVISGQSVWYLDMPLVDLIAYLQSVLDTIPEKYKDTARFDVGSDRCDGYVFDIYYIREQSEREQEEKNKAEKTRLLNRERELTEDLENCRLSIEQLTGQTYA